MVTGKYLILIDCPVETIIWWCALSKPNSYTRIIFHPLNHLFRDKLILKFDESKKMQLTHTWSWISFYFKDFIFISSLEGYNSPITWWHHSAHSITGPLCATTHILSPSSVLLSTALFFFFFNKPIYTYSTCPILFLLIIISWKSKLNSFSKD